MAILPAFGGRFLTLNLPSISSEKKNTTKLNLENGQEKRGMKFGMSGGRNQMGRGISRREKVKHRVTRVSMEVHNYMS